MGALIGLVIFGGLVALYFLPTIMAAKAESKYAGAVFVINTFLGWTIIGWVVALAWAAIPAKLEIKKD